MKKTFENTFDIQGHRGCRGLKPENSIPSMLYALDLGVTTLEMDVVITGDGKVILSHEPFLNHEISTKPDGSYVTLEEEKSLNIFRMDYATLKTYDVGMKPHPRFPQQEKIHVSKPLLADVFQAVKEAMSIRRRPFPYFNIETKSTAATDGLYHPGPEVFIETIMQVVKEYGLQDQVIIQSFDFRTLNYVHANYPAIRTALLVDENEKINSKVEKLNFSPSIISPHYSLVNEAVIKDWHNRRIKIIPWTVNKKEEIVRLRQLGVDGIITDYPNLFSE